MTPDAASTPPTKRSWKRLMVALACVVAVTIIALLATTPKKEPVKVWLVRSTNDFGQKVLLFEGTNGSPREIAILTVAARGGIDQAKDVAKSIGDDSWKEYRVPAGTKVDFNLWAPQKDVPYCVLWAFFDVGRPQTRWNTFRVGCYNFFRAHGMPRLADRFYPTPEMHYIPSTEIKE